MSITLNLPFLENYLYHAKIKELETSKETIAALESGEIKLDDYYLRREKRLASNAEIYISAEKRLIDHIAALQASGAPEHEIQKSIELLTELQQKHIEIASSDFYQLGLNELQSTISDDTHKKHEKHGVLGKIFHNRSQSKLNKKAKRLEKEYKEAHKKEQVHSGSLIDEWCELRDKADHHIKSSSLKAKTSANPPPVQQTQTKQATPPAAQTPPKFRDIPNKEDLNKKFIDQCNAGLEANKKSYGTYFETGEAFGNLLKSTRNPFLVQGGEFCTNFTNLIKVSLDLNVARKALNSNNVTTASNVAVNVASKVGTVVGMTALISKFVVPGINCLTYAIFAGIAVKGIANYLKGTPELTEFQETMKAIHDTRKALESFIDTKLKDQHDLLSQQQLERIEQFNDLCHCMATIESNIINFMENGFTEIKEEIHSQNYVDFITRVELTKLSHEHKLRKAKVKTLAPLLASARSSAMSPVQNGYLLETNDRKMPVLNASFIPLNPASMTGLMGVFSGHSDPMPNWVLLENTINTFRELFNETNTNSILANDGLLGGITQELLKIQDCHERLSDFFNFDHLTVKLLAQLEVIKKDIKAKSLKNSQSRIKVIQHVNKQSLENFLLKGIPFLENYRLGSKRFYVIKLCGKSLADREEFADIKPHGERALTIASLAKEKLNVTYTAPGLIFPYTYDLEMMVRGNNQLSHKKIIGINILTRRLFFVDTLNSRIQIPLGVVSFFRKTGREYIISLENESNPLKDDLAKIPAHQIDEVNYDKSVQQLHSDYFELLKGMCNSISVRKTNLFSQIQSTSVLIRSQTGSVPLVFPKKLIEHLESSFLDIKKYFELSNKGFFIPSYSFCKSSRKLDIHFELVTGNDYRKFCKFTVATFDELTVRSFNFNNDILLTPELLIQALYCSFGSNIGMPGVNSLDLKNGLIAPVDSIKDGLYRIWEKQGDINSCCIHYNYELPTPPLAPAKIFYSKFSAKIMREFFEIRQNLQKSCLSYKQTFYLLESNLNLISSMDRNTLTTHLKEKFGVVDANDILSIYEDYVKEIPEKTPSKTDYDDFVKLVNSHPSHRANLYNQQSEDLANFIKFLREAAINNQLKKIAMNGVALRRIDFKPIDFDPVIAYTDLGEVIESPLQSDIELFTTNESYSFYHDQIERDFEYIDVARDGNCLFHSLIELLKLSGLEGTFKDHADLRSQIVLELNDPAFDKTFLHFDVNQTPEEYLEKMAKDGEWGGDTEIAAFLKIMDKKALPVRLVIHDWLNADSQKRPDALEEKDPTYTTPIPDELRRGTQGPVLHIYRSGVRYQALKPRELSAAEAAIAV